MHVGNIHILWQKNRNERYMNTIREDLNIIMVDDYLLALG